MMGMFKVIINQIKIKVPFSTYQIVEYCTDENPSRQTLGKMVLKGVVLYKDIKCSRLWIQQPLFPGIDPKETISEVREMHPGENFPSAVN